MDNLPYGREQDGSLLLYALIVAVIGAVIVVLVVTTLAYGLPGLKIKERITGLTVGDHRDQVAVIYIEGRMVADRSAEEGPMACSSDIVRYLRKATENPDVKAIVLRVNSPGGTPVAAEEIISQISKTRKVKPVIVSMGDVATSAAYYVSSSSDRIVANPDTFTGSIGVIWVFKNKTRYYDEEGINFYIAKSGNYKDFGADWRGLSEVEKAYVQGIINESYDRFVQGVSVGRRLPLEAVRKIADGRVYTGCKAKEMGLVDELGGLYDAIGLAVRMAGIEGKPEIVYMNEPAAGKSGK